jgi:hypothetical protein
MGLFNKLFGKKDRFVPTPSQQVPGLQPIIVQAIENLYPKLEAQKQVFEYSLRFNEIKKGSTLALLSVLHYSNGEVQKLANLDSPDLDLVIYHIMVDYGFPNLKAAEEWVKSITPP